MQVTQEQVIERMGRGMEMARTGGAVLLSTGEWVVPSSRANGTGYVVDLEQGTCSCPDATYRRSASGKAVQCKHSTAARVAAECLPAGA